MIAGIIQKLETLVGLRGIRDIDNSQDENSPLPVDIPVNDPRTKSLIEQVYQQSKKIHDTPETQMRKAVLKQMPSFLKENLLNFKELYQENQSQQLQARTQFWQELVSSSEIGPQNQDLFDLETRFAGIAFDTIKALILTNLPANIDRIDRIQNFLIPFLLPDHSSDLFLNVTQFCSHTKT